MGRNQVRRKTYGFYKAPSKLPMFTHLVAKDLAKLDEVAERFGVGQGTLASFYLAQILNNEDFLRVLNNQLENWTELQAIRKLQAQYTHDRAVQKGVGLWTLCEFCKIDIKLDFLTQHMAVCKKNPHHPKLPLVIPAVRRK